MTQIRKYPGVFSLTMILGLACSLFYWYVTEPVYQSEAVVEKIMPENQAIAQINMPWGDKSAITEKILTESFIAEAVKNNEELLYTFYIKTDYRKEQTRYRFPYKVKHRVIGNPEFGIQSYTIETVNNNIYKLTTDYNGVKRVLQGEFDKELIENNLAITVSNNEQLNTLKDDYYVQEPEHYFSIESPASMAKRLLSEKEFISAKENNGVVTVICKEGHPDKAQDLAEAVSQYLIGQSGETKSHPSITDIDKRIEEISASLNETESQIADYKKANGITDISIDTETSMAVLKELQLQKTNLEMTLSTLDNLSNYLRKNIDGNNALVEYGTIQDPEFIAQITRLNGIYKDNGDNASASKEVQQLKASIAERILNTRKKTTIQLEGINLAVSDYQRNLASIPDHAAALTGLERKLELDKKVYDLLSDKRARNIVDGGIISTGIGKIVRPATLPTSPSAPLFWMISLIGALATILSFRGITWILERNRLAIVSVEQRLSADEQTPFIGSIGSYSKDNFTDKEIRSLSAKIMMIPNSKTITVTSANRNEGKTAVSLTLAQNLAVMDKKVLLVDMNMYHPSLGDDLDIVFQKTLADVLTRNCDIHDAITLTSRPNLEVLTAGNMIMGINTWLSSSMKEEILAELKKHYDYIIIDTPGVNNHIDAIPMIKLSDITLFAVKAHSSRKESVHVADTLKESHKIEHLYCVMTPANTKRVSRNKITRERTIDITRQTVEKPSLLKRIALWFY